MYDFKSNDVIHTKSINWIYSSGSIRNVGFYIGKVVDNKDEYNQGRVRVFIPELMDENTKEGIWARKVQTDKYSHIVPKIDDLVFVTFVENNFQEPVYLGCINLVGTQNENLCAVNSEIVDENDYWLFNSHDSKFRIRYDETNEKSEYGFVENKVYYFLDNKNKKIKIMTSDDTYIELYDSNNIFIKKNNSTIDLKNQNIEIKVDSVKINISNSVVKIENGGSTVTVNSSDISLKAPIIKLN